MVTSPDEPTLLATADGGRENAGSVCEKYPFSFPVMSVEGAGVGGKVFVRGIAR